MFKKKRNHFEITTPDGQVTSFIKSSVMALNFDKNQKLTVILKHGVSLDCVVNKESFEKILAWWKA